MHTSFARWTVLILVFLKEGHSLVLLAPGAWHLGASSGSFLTTRAMFPSKQTSIVLNKSWTQTTRMALSIPASSLTVAWNKPDAAGGFGAVYFAKTINGDEVVVKVSFKDTFSERLLANEKHFNDKLASIIPPRYGRRWAQFMGSCAIPHSNNFPTEVSNLRALVFRREKGATLDCYLSGPAGSLENSLAIAHEASVLRVEVFKKLLGELLCSVVQLHAAGIMHRDIKPENILVTAHDRMCPIKLIDLGSGCDLASPSRRGLSDETIDPIYAPPELRVDARFPDRYDVFCVAVTALRVLLPSLGSDIERMQIWKEEEMPAVGFDLHQWCIQTSKGRDQTAREAKELLEPRNRAVLTLLQGMLAKDISARTSPEDALKSLGPVWTARLCSVETLTERACAADQHWRRWCHRYDVGYGKACTTCAEEQCGTCGQNPHTKVG